MHVEVDSIPGQIERVKMQAAGMFEGIVSPLQGKVHRQRPGERIREVVAGGDDVVERPCVATPRPELQVEEDTKEGRIRWRRVKNELIVRLHDRAAQTFYREKINVRARKRESRARYKSSSRKRHAKPPCGTAFVACRLGRTSPYAARSHGCHPGR